MALQISRAAGDDAPDFAEANRDQLAIAERPDPDRDIDLVGDRIDALIAHRKIDRDLRILSMNAAAAAQPVSRNAVPLLIRICPRGRPWAEATSASAASTAARILALNKKCFAFLRQHQPPCRPMQKLRPDATLQSCDDARYA